MVQINFALKEVNCKVVYYGPGLSGKTTNLEVVHTKAPTPNVGELTSIATEGDRTLFFDFMPLNLGPVAGMTTKFQIYTVPGQVYYNSTRKLVLQGADGIVFVADSRRGKMDENLESLANLEENLQDYGMDINTIPLVMQYNKRDLPEVYDVEELEQKLNKYKAPYFEAVAVTGEGVFATLKKLSQMVLESLNRQQASTVVRAPKRQSAAAGSKSRQTATAPQAVAVGASGGQSTRTRSQRGSASTSGGPGTQVRKRSGTHGKPAQTVRESVSKSPGVKQVERKKPAAESVVRKRPAARSTPTATPPSSGNKSLAVVAVVILLLGIVGAVLYFGGFLG
jgi:signal recognition particle receptor subunit beta